MVSIVTNVRLREGSERDWDAAMRKRILVDNPARLFGFSA